MTFEEIFKHAKKPKGVIIALLSQFIIMPAASYLLGVAFSLDTFAAIAVMIAGCCPGGNLSNLLAYALRGDMNLRFIAISYFTASLLQQTYNKTIFFLFN